MRKTFNLIIDNMMQHLIQLQIIFLEIYLIFLQIFNLPIILIYIQIRNETYSQKSFIFSGFIDHCQFLPVPLIHLLFFFHHQIIDWFRNGSPGFCHIVSSNQYIILGELFPFFDFRSRWLYC